MSRERKIIQYYGAIQISGSYLLLPVYRKYYPHEQRKLDEAAANDAEPKPLLEAELSATTGVVDAYSFTWPVKGYAN